MSTRTLTRIAAWFPLLVLVVASVAGVQGERGAPVWTVQLLHVVSGLLVFGATVGAATLGSRAAVAEDDAARWKGRWGTDAGPMRAALSRVLHAASRWLPLAEDARDVVARADALAGALRRGPPWAAAGPGCMTPTEEDAAAAGREWTRRTVGVITPDRAAEAAEQWCEERALRGRGDAARPAVFFALAALGTNRVEDGA